MRQVSGFERPIVQWLFVASGIILIAVAAGEALALRRARAEVESVRAADLSSRIEGDRLRGQLTREQAARESFSLELARQRAAGASTALPTLTLSPLTHRDAQPPDPTVVKPADTQLIQLRLVLPSSAKSDAPRYRIGMRTWSGGDAVWSRSGLPMSTIESRRMVTAFITGDVLAPGAYEITLATDAGDKSAEVAVYEVGVRAAERR